MKKMIRIFWHIIDSITLAFEPPRKAKTGMCCKCGAPIDALATYPFFLCDDCNDLR